MSNDSVRSDPYRGFNFEVTIDGIIFAARFAKVSGLSSDIEVAEYREGSDASTVRKLPGLVSYDNVVLERGVSDNQELANWYHAVSQAVGGESVAPALTEANGVDSAFRKTVTIKLLNRKGEEARVWSLKQAWPCKFTTGDLDAGSSDAIIETLELCHEGWVLKNTANSTS